MLTCRWLGVAGLEFSFAGKTLLIDPFLTRPSRMDLLTLRRVPSDRAVIARHIGQADYVLVTHSHYDHLMDVPEVLRLTGASTYGSPNARTLLKMHGCEANVIEVGDRFQLGPFSIEIFPARHTPVPFSSLVNGPLPERWTSKPTRLPLRLIDYRMDTCYSFRIEVDGQSLLVGNHPTPADTLFISPYRNRAASAAVLSAVHPRLVIPIHWDDFTRPLSQPIVPMFLTAAQGLEKPFPPVQRLNMRLFEQLVEAAAPGVEVITPEIFKPISL